MAEADDKSVRTDRAQLDLVDLVGAPLLDLEPGLLNRCQLFFPGRARRRRRRSGSAGNPVALAALGSDQLVVDRFRLRQGDRGGRFRAIAQGCAAPAVAEVDDVLSP